MKHRANIAVFVPHAGCPHTCSFCDQRAISGSVSEPTPSDVRALLAQAAENLGERVRASEIAFFGGSFTAIDPALRHSLLSAAAPFVGERGFAGIRVSTRPDCVDAATMIELREYGVTAVELGAQSMDDAVLARNSRGHTARDVETAARVIKAVGLSLGLQMMTGLPGDTADGALQTAQALADLEPDTMRIYPALTLRGTELERLFLAEEYTPLTLDETVSLCAILLAFFIGRDIKVIRLGLHDSPELGQNVIAGPYHPALRELVEGKILLTRARAAIRAKNLPPGPVDLHVRPGDESKMSGQNRRNLEALEQLGYPARIRTDPKLDYLQVRAFIAAP